MMNETSFKHTITSRAVMLALVVTTSAFAESNDLERAGVRIDSGICKTIFTRLPRTRGDIMSPPAASRTIVIPPSLDFFAHVPKKESRSGDLFFSTSKVKESYVQDIGGLEIIIRWPRVSKPLELSREYTFDQLISDIAKVGDLTSLSCPFSQMNDEHILSVTTSFPGLQCLELGACPITDQAIVQIARLTKLRFLDLSDTAISGRNLKELSDLKLLSSLSLGGCSVDDQSLAILIASLPDLEMIFLHGTDSGAATLNAIAAHERLKVIDLSYTSVDDSAVTRLVKLETLEELYLNETRLSIEAFRDISSAKNLRLLSIMGVPIDVSLFHRSDRDPELEIRVSDGAHEGGPFGFPYPRPTGYPYPGSFGKFPSPPGSE